MTRRPAIVGSLLALALSGVYFATRSQAIEWDGLAFLDQVRGYAWRDLAHLLYVPAVRVMAAALAPCGLTLDNTARLLSALGGGIAVAIVAASPLLGSSGRGARVLAALALATAPLFWSQAGAVEVYAPAIAATLGSLALATAYASSRKATTLAFGVMLGVVAAGFHILALLVAWAWLVLVMRGERPMPREHRRALLAVVLLAFFTLAWLERRAALLSSFIEYARGFLADVDAGAGRRRTTWANAGRLLELTLALGPLSLIGAAALFAGWRRCSSWARLILAWIVPPAVVYVLFGRAERALVMPIIAAGAVACGVVLASWWERSGRRGPLRIGAAILVAAQLAWTAPEVWRAAREPDPVRTRVLAADRVLPPGDVLVCGVSATHARAFTRRTVIAVPEVLHQGLAAGARGGNLVALVQAAIEVERARGHSVWLIDDAFEYVSGVAGGEPWSLLDPTHVITVPTPAGVVRLAPAAPAPKGAGR